METKNFCPGTRQTIRNSMDLREPLKIQSSPKCPTRGRRSATGKNSACGVVSKARKTKFQCRVTFRLAGTKKFASIRYADCLLTPLRRAAYGLYVSKKFFTQRSITSDLAAVVMQPSRMAITNHLATVFWLPSGMASCFTSSSISWDEMWIFRGSLES
jgi:hypothetical protein